MLTPRIRDGLRTCGTTTHGPVADGTRPRKPWRFAMPPDQQIRILTVDDHALLREGIAALLATEPDLAVAGTAGTGREAVEQFRALRPDVTLMDLQMPDMSGAQAISAIRSEFPDARIVVLTTYSGDAQITRALKAGAYGYLLKSLVGEQLVETIRAVHAGRRALSPDATFALASHATDEALTLSEIDILRLIAAGSANKQIANRLAITEDTVKGRVRNILTKLGAHDRTHAVTIALKRGIIELT
jgi:DNA-binding NarL/FixJ family response regulator